jgi:acyl-CoA reductase-like NAD-dependent aldehyde dehydrogenase
VTATATAQLASFNPATGERLGSVGVTPPERVQEVVDGVAKVQPFWAQLTLADRGRYLERAAQVLLDEADDIRDLIVRRSVLDRPRRTGDPGRRRHPHVTAVSEDQDLGLHV